MFKSIRQGIGGWACCVAGLLQQSNASNASYLFQPDKLNVEYDLGDKTIQCGRRADAFKLWLTWKVRSDITVLAAFSWTCSVQSSSVQSRSVQSSSVQSSSVQSSSVQSSNPTALCVCTCATTDVHAATAAAASESLSKLKACLWEYVKTNDCVVIKHVYCTAWHTPLDDLLHAQEDWQAGRRHQCSL